MTAKDASARGQTIDVRRLNVIDAKAGQLRSQIIDADQQHIRSGFRGNRDRAKDEGKKKRCDGTGLHVDVFGRLSLERREYFTSKLNDEPREQQTQKEESPAVGTWLAMGICFFGSDCLGCYVASFGHFFSQSPRRNWAKGGWGLARGEA